MHGLIQKIIETCEPVANIFLHPGANYTYMYNLHTVCKSAHVNRVLVILHYFNAISIEFYAVKCLINILFYVISMFVSGRMLIKKVEML